MNENNNEYSALTSANNNLAASLARDAKNYDVKKVERRAKINKTIGKVVGFIRSEKKQFKQEIVDNLTPEELQEYKEAKENLDYELKYIHDAIHAGWAQGWRGEPYSPPYKHK